MRCLVIFVLSLIALFSLSIAGCNKAPDASDIAKMYENETPTYKIPVVFGITTQECYSVGGMVITDVICPTNMINVSDVRGSFPGTKCCVDNETYENISPESENQ